MIWFDVFCLQNLGDHVIRENGIPTSQKIRNYETVWLMSPFCETKDDLQSIIESLDDTYYYQDDCNNEVSFKIDRQKQYTVIAKFRNPNLFKHEN